MNLLSSLSTLNLATNCQTNWQMATREQKSQTLADAHNTRMSLEVGTEMGAEVGAEVQGKVGGEIGDSGILLNDTIVSDCNDRSFTLDRFFGLPSCPSSIREILSEITSPSQNYRHNNEKLLTRLLGGINPQQLSGRYRPEATVPQ